jgi:acetylornithine deacetylase/succinyl-diaminopimelate desuccinylase-like protein
MFGLAVPIPRLERHPMHHLRTVGVMALAAGSIVLPVRAQDPVAAARDHVAEHRAEIVLELRDFLTIPNVALDSDNIRRNATALVAMMERRGITTRILETGGPPVVYGEIGDPDLPTVLFYCHYDGQPADPSQWEQASPWTPELRTGSIEAGGEVLGSWPGTGGEVDPDWRIYGRSASDDKAPIIALMHMLDAWQAAGVPLRNRLKFIFEGDEEAGSTYLPDVMREHRELLAADLVVMADGPIHPSGNPTADFGLRGLATATITMYGPVVPLHSGHYGNWAPNPAMRLAQLLATMKGPSGEILVEGWDEDVVSLGPAELEALAEYPHDDETRREQLQLGSLDGDGATRMELVARPSLNVRGLRSMFVGAQARTIIPDVAIAELDLRLVAGNRPERQVEKLIAHIERQGYTVVREDPDSTTRVNTPRLVKVTTRGGYPAGRTALDQPASRGLIAALTAAGLGKPVISPTMGGSGPAYVYTDILQAPFAVVPTVNHDNNQHAANENVRLANLFRAVEILAAVASANLRLVP